MKTKVSLLAAVVFSLAAAVGFLVPEGATTVFAFVGEPVPGVQVSVAQEPEGYKGGRPTDNTGVAPFAGLDAGTYMITLKRFNKPTTAYTVTVTGSGGVKNSTVWDAAKKDQFKTSVTLKSGDSNHITVTVTTSDAVPAGD